MRDHVTQGQKRTLAIQTLTFYLNSDTVRVAVRCDAGENTGVGGVCILNGEPVIKVRVVIHPSSPV